MGENVQNIKEYWQNLQSGTKRLLLIIVSVTVIGAVAAIVALRMAENANYSTLFTGLNQEEAQEVVALLQEDGVSYQYSDTNGTIRVPTVQVDQTRAELLSAGYPQSGFTYDMYRDNAGLMTTESDKKQYTLYELQDRLGAQIRLFEGVQDAKVTIAEAADRTYALADTSESEASASVVVTMKKGQNLSNDQASAIKNLIARAVRGMNFTNVAVFDAETMMEVGGSEGGDSAYGTGQSVAALTSLVENHIAGNIRRVLEQLYGQGKVAISVKGTLNMERLIQENVVYTVPEQVEEEDRSGLLYWEDTANENSGAAGQGAGGVAGADANADVPRYTNDTGAENLVDAYANSSATREWLFNTLKEQRQVDPGVLENTTVGVVINTDNMDVPLEDLISLVANSAGISQENARQNITIIRALADGQVIGQSVPVTTTPVEDEGFRIPLPIIIALIAGGLLLLLLLILLLRRRRSKRKAEEEMDLETEPFDLGPEPEGSRSMAPEMQALEEEDSEMSKNEEILNLRMQRNLKLKQNIGEFVDQNPQVAAKLLQSWLRGEGDNNGRKRTQQSSSK